MIAFDLIVAWRVLATVKLGRACPQLPASVLYTADELAVLHAAVEKNGCDSRPLTPREANRRVARLGGDADSGPERLRLGLSRLMDVAWGWRLHHQLHLSPTKSSRKCV